LYIAAALPDVVAYTLIPQVLCATVACFRLVVVCVLGHVFLGEHLGSQDTRSIAVCTLGTMLCVIFGPGGEERSAPAQPPIIISSSTEFHHPKVVAYSVVGLGVLVVFLVIVHADSFGWVLSSSKLYRYSLPVATGLAYAVEKVYNTELGFIQKPENILLEPTWLCMVIAVALLGLTDFYLNVRATQRMPVHLFVPLAFAFGTALQCMQAMVIFDEFADMTVFCSTMTLLGAGLSLVGALMIQPPQFEATARLARSVSSGKIEEGPSDSWMSACPQRIQEGCAIAQQKAAEVWSSAYLQRFRAGLAVFLQRAETVSETVARSVCPNRFYRSVHRMWRHQLKKSRSQELHLV